MTYSSDPDTRRSMPTSSRDTRALPPHGPTDPRGIRTPTEIAKADALHTLCVVESVSADDPRSRTPLMVGLQSTCGLFQAKQIVDDVAPPAVIETTGGGTINQFLEDSAAGRRGLKDGPDVVLDVDRVLDKPDGNRSAVCRPSLLRGHPATQLGTPSLRSPRMAVEHLVDRPLTARAGTGAQPVGTHPRFSSPSVHAMTVAARQRRCFPIRIPLGR